MTITNLDFSELRKADEDRGYGLQSLVAAIGKQLGLRVEVGGKGADKGRDLFFSLDTEVIPGLYIHSKILVSCKDRTESGKQLKTTDLDSFYLRVPEHGCNGFLLVTTISPTDDLITHIREVGKSQKFSAHVWQPDDLKGILLNGQSSDFRFIIAKFFPLSSRQGDSNQYSFDFFCESLIRMERDDSLNLSLEFLDGNEDPVLAWECIEQLTKLEGIDIEKDLDRHFHKVLSLKNKELSEAIRDSIELVECLETWAQDEHEWEEFEMHNIELHENGAIDIDFLATALHYTMGTNISKDVSGTIRWSNGEFSIHSVDQDTKIEEPW